MRFLTRLFPVKGDPWWEVGRKLLFLVALVVLVGSLAMLLNESVIIPQKNEEMREELVNLRVISGEGQLTPEEEAFDGYPEGIDQSFKKLYYLNNDVRGWITYKSCNVDNVVMYSKEREYYLYRNIYRINDKNGSLFFDASNDLTDPSAHYKSLVIYGHNMASGQMFAGLNQLGKSVDVMKRAGSIIKLDTLTVSNQYKIFAVVIQDSKADIKHYFSIQETSFRNDQVFLSYVDALRARSLYDFDGVDVKAEDDILILYTCCPKSIAGFDDARLAVVARKVRTGENANVDPATIKVNKDVIMPYAYYTAQKKTPHSFYQDGKLPTGTTTTTPDPTTGTNVSPTSGEGGDTTTAEGGDTTTAVVINPTNPTTNTPVNPTTGTGTNPPTDPTTPGTGTETTPAPTEPTTTVEGEPTTTVEGEPTTEPSETEPTETEPTGSEPSETEPTETEPTETEPTEPTPTETEPPAEG